MSLLVFLDETGDHSMTKIDADFPHFALVMLICDRATYINNILPLVYQLKLDFWGHEGIILHSRDIRMSKGDYAFLRVPEKRKAFYDQLSQIMGQDYTLIAVVIDKVKHKSKYSSPLNPYGLSLTFAMERLLALLEEKGQSEVEIIAEARGKNEDNELRSTFLNIITEGTGYIPADRFRKIKFSIKFLPKGRNIIGTQLADLAAYPIARKTQKPEKPNPAYEIIKDKFFQGKGRIHGLKVFP